MLYAVTDTSLHYYPDDKSWPFKRIQKLFANSHIKEAEYAGWGWKEPNSYLLINQFSEYFPNLKFIHTIRHGLDMAFSKNQKQLRVWGGLFGDFLSDGEDYLPNNSLKYWAKANKYIEEVGKTLGPNRYLQINYDQLCTNPKSSIDRIIAFLGVDINEEIFKRSLTIPFPPESLGRYKKHDLSQFDQEDLVIVESFGYKI